MKRGIEIGNYVLAELLSSGGMGQVWLAHREFEGGGQMAVAIKFPHASGVLDPRIREGLLDEARLQMRLQHTNIPRVVDMGVHEGLPYFVMDYIAGCSLAQFLGRIRDLGMPLRFELIAHIAREIAYALRYAHGYHMQGEHLPVIHRDVAPKNVLISGQGGVYVVDFGVSEAAGIHTSRNFIKGTLLYMAPEHALGFPSTKSDGWGLGAILWEMIEGRQFRCEVDAEDLRRAANEGRRGPLTRPGIPEPLRFVTEGLLRVDERERLTLDEVINPLESTEFPPQRSSLADLLRRRFGPAVHRSGQTLHDFKMPEQLDRTIAAAKVVKDAGPGGLDTWSAEAFTAAGAPVVVPVGGTRPIPRAVALDDDDDSAPRFVGGERPTSMEAEAEGGPPTEAEPSPETVTPTEPEPRARAAAEDERPERTEHLPRVPWLGEHQEPTIVPTEPVDPPSGARAKAEEPRADGAPVPRAHGRTVRAPEVAEGSVPMRRTHGRTVRAPEAAGSARAPEAAGSVRAPEAAGSARAPEAAGSARAPREAAESAREDITAVWGIEPPMRAHAPLDRDDLRLPVEPEHALEPDAAKAQAVRGEMWVDVALDRGEAPASVPRLPLPDAAVPTPVPVAPSEPIRVGPAAVPHKRWAFGLVAALWLTVGGALLWAVWPRGAEREAEPKAVVMTEPVIPVKDSTPASEVQPASADSSAQVDPGSGPTVEPAVPVTAPESPPSVPEPVVPTEPEPPSRVEPVVPASEPEPSVEPTRVPEPAEPIAKPSKPKPARKKKPEPLPPVRVKIALLVTAPMDIEIGGVHRSLDSRMTKATLAVTPGRVRVRWRRPTGEWRRRIVLIEPGVDYVVGLEPSGPSFEAVEKKP